MPYITEEQKKHIEPETSGELNYAITKVVLDYLKNNVVCYRSLNDVMGALECAKQEFYRRVVVPYEEIKRAQNGDVYFYD